MRTNYLQEPNWKMTGRCRLGAKYRSNRDRYVHVNNIGWFLFLRGELNIKDGLETQHGLAGPFRSFQQAQGFLQQVISAHHRLNPTQL